MTEKFRSNRWLSFLSIVLFLSALAGCSASGTGGQTVDGDQDGDGIKDADEARFGTNPNIQDTDGDGLDDYFETETLTCLDPLNPDTDGDGLLDGNEWNGAVRTDPCKSDSDGDGLDDFFETETAPCLDPLKADTDGDNLLDGDEWNGAVRTDPCKSDSDGDGVADNDDSSPLIAERTVHVEPSGADWALSATWRGNKLTGSADHGFDVISVGSFLEYAAPGYPDTSWATPDQCPNLLALGLHDSASPPCYLDNHQGSIILRGHVSRPAVEDTLVSADVNAQFLFGDAQELPSRAIFCSDPAQSAAVFLNGQPLCSSTGGLGTFTNLATSGLTEDVLASPPIYGDQSISWQQVPGFRGWGISVDLHYRHTVSVTLADLH